MALGCCWFASSCVSQKTLVVVVLGFGESSWFTSVFSCLPFAHLSPQKEVFWHLVNKAPGRFFKDITTPSSVIFPFFHGSVLTVGLSCLLFGRYGEEVINQSPL